MKASDWIAIAGWFAAFILAFVLHRITRKKKVVAWALLGETDLFPKDMSEMLGVPVRIMVGDKQDQSLSSVRLRVGGAGNEVVENITVAVKFEDTDSQLLHSRWLTELGEFEEHVRLEQLTSNEPACRIRFDYLNPGRSVDFEFLLGNYEPGSVAVDLAAPGVEFRRRDPARWDLPDTFLQGLTLKMMGVGYEPTVGPLREIVEELRVLRQQVRALRSPPRLP